MMNSLRGAISLTLIFGMAACTSGSNTLETLPASVTSNSNARTHHRKGALVLHIHIPKKHRHHKRKHYISPATQSMTVAIAGPTTLNQTVGLTPTSAGCSSALTGTYCTLTISGLAPGDYTGSITTYDQTGGNGNALSSNQSIGFTIVAGASNTIGIALGGIPQSVALIPGANATLSGSMSAGFSLSKCGTDKVSVVGVDADGNYIIGSGAPTPSLDSDGATLIVATPAPSTPNTFTLARSTPPPAPSSTVHLTATVTPDDDTGASPVSSSAISMTFNHDICGYLSEWNTGVNGGASPLEITTGPDGNLWFTEQNGYIGTITTSGSSMQEYPVTSGSSAHPTSITVGPDHNLWFTECAAGNIGKITTSGSVTEYPIYTNTGTPPPANPEPYGIATGSDGKLWFTEMTGNKVANMTTDGATVKEYSDNITGTDLNFITAGPDGDLWFTEFAGNNVAKVDTSGNVTEYPITSPSYSNGITVGPDNNIWFVEYGGGRIASITTSGSLNEYPIGIYALGITAGPDGNLWFTDYYSSDKIGKISTSGGGVKEYTVGFGPWGITTGPDGNLWFTEIEGGAGSGAIGQLQ